SRLATMLLLFVMLLVLIPTVRNRHEWFAFLSALTKEGAAGEGPEPDLPVKNQATSARESEKTAAASAEAANKTPADTAAEKTAVEKTAVEKSAVEKAAVEKTAVEKTAVEKTAVEKTGAKSPDQSSPKSLADAPLPPLANDEEIERERLKGLLSVVV